MFDKIVGAIFLLVVGLGAHVVWYSNTHHSSGRPWLNSAGLWSSDVFDYAPEYCNVAPVAWDACTTALQAGRYLGLRTSSKDVIRQGGLLDPDSEERREMEAARTPHNASK